MVLHLLNAEKPLLYLISEKINGRFGETPVTILVDYHCSTCNPIHRLPLGAGIQQSLHPNHRHPPVTETDFLFP
jgi:hypothetical protein